MTIPLSKGLQTVIDEEDYDLVSNYRWYAAEGAGGLVYAVSRLRLHRVIVDAPLGMIVDHINGDTLDNRRSNLRVCTPSQNQLNTGSKGGSSRFNGVSFSKQKGKWLAQFFLNGAAIYCGLFEREEDAARAVDRRKKELCGEFARLNFPEEKGEE